jgi:hypothetical protein
MLCRVSCKACHISCLWTDDPQGFLASVCMRYRHCQAKLIDESIEEAVIVKRARSVSSRRVSGGKGAMPRAQGRHSPAAR